MSLINVSVNNSSLEAEDITGSFKERSSSMLNINEPNSGTYKTNLSKSRVTLIQISKFNGLGLVGIVYL